MLAAQVLETAGGGDLRLGMVWLNDVRVLNVRIGMLHAGGDAPTNGGVPLDDADLHGRQERAKNKEGRGTSSR